MLQVIIAVIVVGLSLLLATKKRYRWIYILYKTLPRDLKGGYRFLKINLSLWMIDKTNKTVVKCFKENLKRNPHKIAFYFEDKSWTFQEIEDYSDKVGLYFKSLGYKPGDTVALMLENCPEYICIWLGLAKIRAVVALINTNLTKDSLIHSIVAAKCKGLIFGSNLSKGVVEVLPKLPFKTIYQFNDIQGADLPNHAIDLQENLKNVQLVELNDYKDALGRDGILYVYTSGTTGLPKAAVINNLRASFMAKSIYTVAAFRSDDIVYNPLPLYHSAGGILGAGQALINNLTVVIRKKFSATNFWKDCDKYNCTIAQYIGEICRYLLAVPQTEHVNTTVRVMVGNGLKMQIWDKFVTRFKIKEVFEFFGSTEGNSNLVNIDSRCGAVGFLPRYASALYPVTLIKCNESTGEPIRNDKGFCTKCEVDEPGVFIGKINPKKTIAQFEGYADKSATQKKILKNVFNEGDLYFNSGDILIQDEFGYFYFKDRTGDTFRWKGENIATTEVEAVISNVINLNDAVVFGVEIPHTDGRAGMAAIVDTDGVLDLAHLYKGLADNLPVYSIPLFLRVLKSVPLTGTYKIKKVELQAEGFDIKKIKDDLYFLNMKSKIYERLTIEMYNQIMAGIIRV